MPQGIDQLLGHHDAFALAPFSKGAKVVVPIAEEDQRKPVFAKVLFGKVDAAKQMLPYS